MPTKKKLVQKQKQKQRQSVVVNVNLAKARARSSAKKSRAKGGGRGYMLPPPIYASPIDRLTPAMYGSQGQQIQQQTLDQMLKNFLSNQQNQQVGSFKTLGSAPGSTDNLNKPNKPFKSFQDYQDSLPKFRKKTPEELEIIKEKYRQKLINKGIDPYQYQEIPTPFQNEEKSYLKVSEPDLTAPKFSQNEARVSQQNIYDMLNRMEEKTQKEINKLNPEPFRRPDRRPPVRIPAEERVDPNIPVSIYNKIFDL